MAEEKHRSLAALWLLSLLPLVRVASQVLFCSVLSSLVDPIPQHPSHTMQAAGGELSLSSHFPSVSLTPFTLFQTSSLSSPIPSPSFLPPTPPPSPPKRPHLGQLESSSLLPAPSLLPPPPPSPPLPKSNRMSPSLLPAVEQLSSPRSSARWSTRRWMRGGKGRGRR